MKHEIYIARRLLSGGSRRKSTGLMVSVSVFGIALSLAVMIVAVAVTTGFKYEVSRKVIGFAADIQVTNLEGQSSLYNLSPVSSDLPFTEDLRALPEVRHIQRYCIKPGIMKSVGEVQGVVLKGVGSEFDWDFFRRNLKEGFVFQVNDSTTSNKIVLSSQVAKAMQLTTGDTVVIYFVQEPLRMRPFVISGIYETGLVEFDKLFALVDMAQIQRLNGWTRRQISGFEVFINDFDRLEPVTAEVFDIAGNRIADDGSGLLVQNVRELYSTMFDWLGLQDTTAFIVLLLMILVAGFNMISGLLIIILERTPTIGVLKALGADNAFIRKVFLSESLWFIGKGLLWGNVIALTLCWLQWRFGIIGLDEESYFLSMVPIRLKMWHLLSINIGTSVAIMLMLLVPSSIISRISPDTAIKFR